MKEYRKVVWAEGVMLGQQHFQVWEEYLFHQQKITQQHTNPFHWGIVSLDIDEHYLCQGIVKVKRCIAIMPDRRLIDFNDANDGPLTLNLPDKEPQDLNLYLALPHEELVSGISGYPKVAHHSPCWQGYYAPQKDLYDTERTREVLLGRQNIILSTDIENLAKYTTIKIANLSIDKAQGVYYLDSNFIPAAIKIAATENLSTWLNNFVRVIDKQLNSIKKQLKINFNLQNKFEYTGFIYLNIAKVLSENLVKLRILQQNQLLHPFELYVACTTFLGVLASNTDEQYLPIKYNHHKLTAIFQDIFTDFNSLIAKSCPKKHSQIKLVQISANKYHSTEITQQILENKNFCLAIYCDSTDYSSIERIQLQIKIASPATLDDIINSFTQGIDLHHLKKPEENIATKSNCYYFQLDSSSVTWQNVLKEQKIAFFINQELAHVMFELIYF